MNTLNLKNDYYHSVQNLVLPSPVYKCKYKSTKLRFQILTAANIKVTVLWDDEPCSLLQVYGRFERA
jgi:hypothetical protein